jgi:predicted DNA-binding transcriptional regulator AlpA
MPSASERELLSEVERVVRACLSDYATPAVEFLSTQQAAHYLGLSIQYLEIARHHNDGSGPDYIKLPRAVRYRRADLDKWMEEHRNELPMHPVPRARTLRRAKAVA